MTFFIILDFSSKENSADIAVFLNSGFLVLRLTYES